MVRYISKRIFWALFTLLIIIFVLFMLLQFMPGTPFDDEKLTDVQKVLMYAKYGLDQPFWIRFRIYLENILFRGDFGISLALQKNQLVQDIVLPRLGISIRIGIQALALGTTFGILFGILSGTNKNTKIDTASTLIAVLGVSIPSYVFALILSFFFGYKWSIFPITFRHGQPLFSSILPTISLSMFVMAQTTRFLRTELIEVMSSDYIKLVESKGVKRSRIILKHGIRNALISVITILGPLTVTLMTGSLVVERVYGVPGIGDLLVEGILSNDFNVIVMIAFIYSALYIIMNLTVDILYGVIDPRIRVAKGG